MNCLDFRRRLLADPHTVDAEAVAHRDTCPQCQEHARAALEFEVALEDAMRVPVDPALAQRIVLDRRLKNVRQGRRRALAAGLAVFAGVGGLVSTRWLRPDPVAVASIDHVVGEPSSFAARQQVAGSELGAALSLSGARLRADIAGSVTYLHDCPVPGGWGKHIVVNSPVGRFTLITMPSCPVARRSVLGRGGWYAAVAPARAGSYAIVAETAQAVERAERYLAAGIDWSTA
jgi:Protein of unknown function (DUF3379)